MMGAMRVSDFKELVEDLIGLKLTDEEADEIQEEIVQKLCK